MNPMPEAWVSLCGSSPPAAPVQSVIVPSPVLTIGLGGRRAWMQPLDSIQYSGFHKHNFVEKIETLSSFIIDKTILKKKITGF